MRKYIPLLIIGIAITAYFVFNSASMTLFTPLLIVGFFVGLVSLYVWVISKKKVSPEVYAKDFARLIRQMIDRRMIFGVFIFSDGWWRLFCMQNEDDPDGETIGEWTLEEVEAMVENGVTMMFKDGHLDRKLLTEGVSDVNVGYVTIDEEMPQSIGITIVYEDKNENS